MRLSLPKVQQKSWLEAANSPLSERTHLALTLENLTQLLNCLTPSLDFLEAMVAHHFQFLYPLLRLLTALTASMGSFAKALPCKIQSSSDF
jgi:hypothetical protein